MFYAVVAGFFAAVASASVKMAFSGTACKIFALFGIAGYIICNVLMWWAHIRSLKECSSTFKAVAVNTGINFIVTSLIGAMCFDEVHSVGWWCGIIILISGTTLIINHCECNEKAD